MLTELGLTVSRQIPFEHLGGVLSGAYTLHGGVLRNAGGQIVAQLVSGGPASALTSLVPGLNTLSSLGANFQLYSLGRDVAAIQSTLTDVLNVATVGAVLSGLGLAYSQQSRCEKAIQVWREAIDSALRSRQNFSVRDSWMAELNKVSEGNMHTLGAYYRPWK